jgi:hypothetical protein
VSGEARDSVRQSARPVIELDSGILAYPAESYGTDNSVLVPDPRAKG